jgi:hypothetical protein
MRILTTALLAAALWAAPAVHATVIVGGNGKADCYTGADVVTDNPVTKTTKTGVIARACDGKCVFKVKACVGLSEPTKCTATALDSLTVTPTGALPAPATLGPDNACGAEQEITLDPAGKKKAKSKIKLVGLASAAKPKKDTDNLKLTCLKNDANDGCAPRCPETCDNPQGGADQVVLTIGPEGSDLDNGWTGNSQNFPLVPNGKIGLCASNCDGSTDTSCDVCGRVGEGTISGTTFGAPLPLFASNVPVCVISRWREDIRGTLDEATGDTSINIKLFSDTYLTSRDDVCPQCKNGKCNAASGANAGKDCTVEATLPVYVSSTRTDNYDLSSTCVFSSAPTATLRIDFDPLTSGTTDPLTGPIPCTNQPGEPIGVPEQPDECGTSGCGAECTGTACVTKVPDPLNPGQMICVDSKGGASQFCCNNNTAKPCHKLRDGGVVTRTGVGGIPQPPLPDQTYPKTQQGVLVSTFCIPATGTNTIDSVTGLPGPGVIQIPGESVWTKQ